MVGAAEAITEETPSSRVAVYVTLAFVPLLVIAAALLPSGDDPESDPPPPTSGEVAEPDLASVEVSPTEPVSGIRVAFAAGDQVVIVDPVGPDATIIDVALERPELSYDEPFVLIADDRRTLAVHPSFPDELLVLASNYRLVPTAAPGRFVFRRSATGERLGEVFLGSAADGSFGRRLEIPLGTREIVVPGLGLLLVGPDGTTVRAGFADFEPVSDSPVLTATPSHRVEIRCSGGLDCTTVLVDSRLGTEIEVPGRIAQHWTSPSVSPDGRWIVAGGPDGVVRYDTTSWGAVPLVGGPIVSGPAWTTDASAVAVIDGVEGSSTLRLLPVDGRPPVVVDLASLGVGAPIRSNLIAFG